MVTRVFGPRLNDKIEGALRRLPVRRGKQFRATPKFTSELPRGVGQAPQSAEERSAGLEDCMGFGAFRGSFDLRASSYCGHHPASSPRRDPMDHRRHCRTWVRSAAIAFDVLVVGGIGVRPGERRHGGGAGDWLF